MSLEVFVLGHKEFACPDRPWLTKVNLRQLSCSYDHEQLCESVFLLADLPTDAEYVGCVTYRWNEKNPYAYPLEEFGNLRLHPSHVLFSDDAPAQWPYHSHRNHRGMMPYLLELADRAEMELGRPSLYCNSFISHRKVYLDFQRFFRESFEYFYQKYAYAYDFHVADWQRAPACYFYERFATLYFGNQSDLKLKRMLKMDDTLYRY